MGETAYGHTGFTGTSIWIDPARDLFVILLTNWACGDEYHPVPPWAALADVRADVADVAEVAALDATPLARSAVTLRSGGAHGWQR
jgi:CubicO group peptidase (beta-lactamase class C family)